MAKSKHWRERKKQEIARKKGKRPPYARVLIVCEGSKTEPQYFEDIRRKNRVPTAHIRITNADGTQPRQIVDFAEALFNETKEFDWVFAVFDRDEHPTYHDALNKAAELDRQLKNDERAEVRFVAAPSVPNFELWLLLHFEDTQAFFSRHEVIRKLKNHLVGYNKGMPNVYTLTEPILDTAIERSQRLKQRFSASSGTDPYTQVDQIVQLMKSIRVP